MNISCTRWYHWIQQVLVAVGAAAADPNEFSLHGTPPGKQNVNIQIASANKVIVVTHTAKKGRHFM